MTESAKTIAHDAFTVAELIIGAVLVTHLPITKPDRPKQKQQMKNVVQTTFDLVKACQLDEARSYLMNYSWTTPQTVWWCDDEEVLAKVISEIESMSKRQNRGGSFGYDVHTLPGGSVACVMFWLD